MGFKNTVKKNTEEHTSAAALSTEAKEYYTKEEIDTLVDKLDTRIESIDKRVSVFISYVSILEKEVSSLANSLKELREEMESNFEPIKEEKRIAAAERLSKWNNMHTDEEEEE